MTVAATGSQLTAAMRTGLRRLAKAVVVVTCSHEGRRWAMAATAVCEVSLEPPSLLICVNRTASIFEPLAQGGDFCINILHSSHESISSACGGQLKGEARFDVGQWHSGTNGLQYLADTQASFFCHQAKRVDFGTHAIIIGEVFDVMTSEDVDPLVYIDGRYASVS
jgi:flavin reductase (DIM6/NTAB) family NADH-FMN oxidoreductase RutF